MGSQAYTELDRHAMAMDSTWAEQHVSENKINNIVVFNLPRPSFISNHSGRKASGHGRRD
jgi:hypothetical protein